MDIDISSPDFNPDQFLASLHARTTTTDLRLELETLRRATSDKTLQLKSLVHEHFDHYLTCHDAVRQVGSEIRRHHKQNDTLQAHAAHLRRVADQRLSDVLKLDHECRVTGRAIDMLSAVEPALLALERMKKSMRKQNWQALLKDYAQLQSMTATSGEELILINIKASADHVATEAKELLLDCDISESERMLEQQLDNLVPQTRPSTHRSANRDLSQ